MVRHSRINRPLQWGIIAPPFSTLGIVGYGRTGRRVAAVTQAAFELKVLAYSPSADPDRLAAEGVRKCDALADLLAVADVVSLHVPLRDATRQLIDADALAQMKPDTILTTRPGRRCRRDRPHRGA